MTHHLVSPDGFRIIGTRERIPGVAYIINVRPDINGFAFDWGGETEVDWNGQTTKSRLGEIVFVDEGGNEWLQRELKLVEDA